MKYIAIKFGTKYVSSLKSEKNIELTKDVNKAVLWPMDMEPMLEEAVEDLEVRGFKSRIVMLSTKEK